MVQFGLFLTTKCTDYQLHQQQREHRGALKEDRQDVTLCDCTGDRQTLRVLKHRKHKLDLTGLNRSVHLPPWPFDSSLSNLVTVGCTGRFQSGREVCCPYVAPSAINDTPNNQYNEVLTTSGVKCSSFIIHGVKCTRQNPHIFKSKSKGCFVFFLQASMISFNCDI